MAMRGRLGDGSEETGSAINKRGQRTRGVEQGGNGGKRAPASCTTDARGFRQANEHDGVPCPKAAPVKECLGVVHMVTSLANTGEPLLRQGRGWRKGGGQLRLGWSARCRRRVGRRLTPLARDSLLALDPNYRSCWQFDKMIYSTSNTTREKIQRRGGLCDVCL